MSAPHWSEVIEPAADQTHSPEMAAQVSIAISLKRIADAMTSPVNEYGETMPEAIAGNLKRAAMEGYFK